MAPAMPPAINMYASLGTRLTRAAGLRSNSLFRLGRSEPTAPFAGVFAAASCITGPQEALMEATDVARRIRRGRATRRSSNSMAAGERRLWSIWRKSQ